MAATTVDRPCRGARAAPWKARRTPLVAEAVWKHPA
jgi:hypothetical protein